MTEQEAQELIAKEMEGKKKLFKDLTSDLMDAVVNSEVIKKLAVIMSRSPEATKQQIQDLLLLMGKILSESEAMASLLAETCNKIAYRASAEHWTAKYQISEQVHKELLNEMLHRLSPILETKVVCGDCGFGEESCRESCELGIKEWVDREYKARMKERGFSSEEDYEPVQEITTEGYHDDEDTGSEA